MEPKKKNNTSKGVKSGVCAGAKTDKTKVSCYFMPHTLAEVDHIYKSDNCSTRTEFIEKAVRFYLGYLNEESGINYISPMITETVKAEIKGTEQRLARLMFKVAVELGKLSHMLAAVNEIDKAGTAAPRSLRDRDNAEVSPLSQRSGCRGGECTHKYA